MDEVSPNNSQNRSKFPSVQIILTGLIIVILSYLLWEISNLESRLSDLESSNNASESSQQSEVNQENNGWNTAVRSTNGIYEVTLPDGWGPILKPRNGDELVYSGVTQPTVEVGKPVEVQEIEAYGGDGGSLFSIVFGRAVLSIPEDDSTHYTQQIINKSGKKNLTVKKHVYIYTKDTEVGFGHLRLAGDREYHYHINLGEGKELNVFYSVLGSDPRNQVEIVDQIVQSIKIL